MPHSENLVRLTSLKNSFNGGINIRLQNNQTLDNSATCGGSWAHGRVWKENEKFTLIHRHGKFNYVGRERELRHHMMGKWGPNARGGDKVSIQNPALVLPAWKPNNFRNNTLKNCFYPNHSWKNGQYVLIYRFALQLAKWKGKQLKNH